MFRLRALAIVSMALAACALALTVNELLQDRPRYLTFPNGGWLGGVVLLALVVANAWSLREVRHDRGAVSWAKTALTLSATLPLIWAFRYLQVWREVSLLEDTDVPEEWSARMVGDMFQTHLVALGVTISVLACIIASCACKTAREP
jgi:hypothetical protein